MHRALTFLLFVLLAAPANSAVLKICIDNQPHPPFVLPDRDGLLQTMARQAADVADYKIDFIAAPIARCREMVRTGDVDGFLAATYIKANLSSYVYPLKRGEIDNARAVVTASIAVYRKRGVNAGWDGKQFSKLHSKVLIPFGVFLLEERLSDLKVEFDNGARSNAANFDKLLAGRGELAVMNRNDGRQLLEDPRFAGKIEALPINFSEEAFFLVLSRAFYRKAPQQAETIWNEIGKLRLRGR